MTKRPLKLLLIAFAALVPLLASPAQAADINGALAFVPNQTMAVAGINGDGVRNTELYKLLFAQAMADGGVRSGLAEFKKETGFDANRDVHALVVGVMKDIEQKKDNFVLVAEAKLSEAKTLAFMKKKGETFKTVNGVGGKHHLLGKRGKGFMAFRGKYVIIGGASLVNVVLGKQGLGPELKSAVAKVKRRDMFAVAKPTASMRKQLAREHKDLGQLELASFGADLHGGGVKADIDARMATAATSRRLATMLREGLAEIRKDRKVAKMGLDGHLRNVRVGARGRNISASMKLSKAQVKTLLDLAKMFL